MDFFTKIADFMTQTFGGSIWVMLPIVSFILIVAQWRLFTKAGQSGIQSVIPGWNVVGFMKIIGRPAWHSLFIIVPLLAMAITFVADSSNIMNFISGGFSEFASVPVSGTVMGLSSIVLAVFLARTHIDLCNSFGRTSVIDYVMVIALNVLYVLYLGLDYEVDYAGPSYGVQEDINDSRAFA